MSPTCICFRVLPEEKMALEAQVQAAGFREVSSYVRHVLGLTPLKRGAPRGAQHWRKQGQQQRKEV